MTKNIEGDGSAELKTGLGSKVDEKLKQLSGQMGAFMNGIREGGSKEDASDGPSSPERLEKSEKVHCSPVQVSRRSPVQVS